MNSSIILQVKIKLGASLDDAVRDCCYLARELGLSGIEFVVNGVNCVCSSSLKATKTEPIGNGEERLSLCHDIDLTAPKGTPLLWELRAEMRLAAGTAEAAGETEPANG